MNRFDKMFTSFRTTSSHLRKIFSTYGIPERIETDNGPPFNSIDFKTFAKEYGFQHHRTTPEQARANGEAERFMKVLNKTKKKKSTQRGRVDRHSDTEYAYGV